MTGWQTLRNGGVVRRSGGWLNDGMFAIPIAVLGAFLPSSLLALD